MLMGAGFSVPNHIGARPLLKMALITAERKPPLPQTPPGVGPAPHLAVKAPLGQWISGKPIPEQFWPRQLNTLCAVSTRVAAGDGVLVRATQD